MALYPFEAWVCGYVADGFHDFLVTPIPGKWCLFRLTWPAMSALSWAVSIEDMFCSFWACQVRSLTTVSASGSEIFGEVPDAWYSVGLLLYPADSCLACGGFGCPLECFACCESEAAAEGSETGAEKGFAPVDGLARTYLVDDAGSAAEYCSGDQCHAEALCAGDEGESDSCGDG